jgi:four helix bundle protein
MKYERFEDLPVWNAAIELGLAVFALTDDRVLSQQHGLQDQIRRAAMSVSNNIAEGFERGSTAELLAFLYIARGSAGEVRSMLRFLDRWPAAAHLKSQISNPKSEISNLISLAESCSRQIRGWAESLQNSDIKGQRHLNDASRRAYQSRQRAAEFRANLSANQEEILTRWQEQLAKYKPPGAPETKE